MNSHAILKAATLGSMLIASQVCWGSQIFFGEDLGLGESTPLSTFPNASAAETEFLSFLTGVGTEDFESFNSGIVGPIDLTFSGAGTATLSGGGQITNVPSGSTNGVGRYSVGTGSSKFWETSSSAFQISFSNPIAAFGFYGVDIGDFNGQITLTTAGGVSQSYTAGSTINSPGGSVLFWGLIDTENLFTSISFGNTAAGTDFFGFDRMTIGSLQQVTPPAAVPEPATLALLGFGLAGLGGVVRRRRKA